MIISHKYEFIYLKTRKTASTSLEIALSKFCGPDDIITPITKEGEKMREKMGFKGAQNYNIPLNFYTKRNFYNLLLNGKVLRFKNHNNANTIKEYKKECWENYFKFTFERNPFDRAVSFYFWSTTCPRPRIGDYLDSVKRSRLSNWDIYTINDHIEADFVGEYENLKEDLNVISRKVDLPEEIRLPNAKSEQRPDQADYSEILNERARKRIEIVCAKEMKIFGYSW